MGKAETVHFSFAIVLSDTEMQMISNPLTEGGQGHLVTFIKSHLVEYFKYFQKRVRLDALQTIILALLSYVYKKSVSS